MLTHLANFIHAFIQVPLITGMLIALWTPVCGRKAFRSVLISLAVGVLGGITVYLVSLHQEAVTAARTSLHAAAVFAAVLNAGVLLLPGNRYRAVPVIGWGAAVFFTAALAATALFPFFTFIAEQALSASSVLNTELILNIGGILTGFFLIAFLVPLTAHLSTKSGRGMISGFLLFASALLVIQWCAEIVLGLMRMDTIELTSTRLSFVAKVTKYAYVFPYIQALMIAALSFVFFVRRNVLTAHDLSGMQKAERRKARSRVLFEMRWLKCTLGSVLIACSVLLYHDLYASRPPKVSTPVNLKPDADGLVKVKIDDLGDGNLHRYSHVTDDGHVVRFFMIDRSKGRKRIGVVYDACMLCGDTGYLQEKNEVICIACNVRIFIPSIGKAGGCNPIPLAHRVEGGYVIVRAEDLEKGARYFSEVVAVKVKDPVTGKELTSHEAPQRYEHKGRTYFFESGESVEKFKVSPETYVGDRQSRYFRAQGNAGK